MSAIPARLDHLVLACPHFGSGVEWVECKFGVRPLPGGSHPAWRTRNAVLPLSESSYLEIIGPDPLGGGAGPATIFGIHALEAPRLVTWSARSDRLSALVEHALSQGIRLGKVSAGRRERPDGTLLTWELTDPFAPRADGLIPFFIHWGEARHPGRSGPAEVTLQEFHAEHPDPAALRAQLVALDLDLPVESGAEPRLVATLQTPLGPVKLG